MSGGAPLVGVVPPAKRRTELERDILAAARLPGRFVISGGVQVDHYVDKYLFLTKPTILRRLASVMAERIPTGIDRLVGCEPGSLAVVAALSLETGIPFVSLCRTERTPGGWVPRGELHAGERVVLVEDVVASGRRATSLLELLRREHADVDRVIAVVDRGEGAAAAVALAGHRFEAVLQVRSQADPLSSDQ